MKKQHSIKEICGKINTIYAKKELNEEDCIQISRLIHRFNDTFKKEQVSEENLQIILATILTVAQSQKKYKQILEEEFLRYIYYFPNHLFGKRSSKDIKIAETVASKESIVRQLKEFVKQLFTIKIPRDAFAGKRKGYAIKLLGKLAEYFDVPEFIPTCKTALKTKSKTQFLLIMEALEAYYLKKAVVLDKEIIALLDKRLIKAKDRTEAICCLLLQVKTNTISEMEALGRIDTWKEENW